MADGNGTRAARGDEARAARLAQALRENLRRRKAQAREAAPPAPPPPEPDGS